MGTVTLNQIHEDLIGIKRDIEQLKTIITEDFEVSEDVAREITESRRRSRGVFISQDEMRKEFG